MATDIETELKFNAILANMLAAQKIMVFNICLYLQKLESDRKFEAKRQKRISDDLNKRFEFEKEQYQKRIKHENRRIKTV
jgi:hypothetical protein